MAFISANGAVRSGLIAKDGRGKGEGERVGPEAGAVGIPGIRPPTETILNAFISPITGGITFHLRPCYHILRHLIVFSSISIKLCAQ